jgi:hypothetical protein
MEPMSVLYSYEGAAPAPLPFAITLPNSFTRTDPESFTPEEIAAAGYTEASAAPEYDPETHHAPTWVGAAWVIEPLTAEELADREEQRRLAAMPGPVTRRQAKLALLAVGKLDEAEAALAAAGKAAQIEWADALTFERDNTLINAIGGAVGLSEEEIGDLFRTAATL